MQNKLKQTKLYINTCLQHKKKRIKSERKLSRTGKCQQINLQTNNTYKLDQCGEKKQWNKTKKHYKKLGKPANAHANTKIKPASKWVHNWLCTTHIQTVNNMQKWNKPKKCTTNFVNTKRKKDVTTQSKKQNTNKTYVSNAYNTIVHKHARKSAPAGFESPEQTWPTATARFLGNRNCWSIFLNKKKSKILIGAPRGM